jgi:hypothetical protein
MMLGSNDLGIVMIARSGLVEVAARQCKGESSKYDDIAIINYSI